MSTKYSNMNRKHGLVQSDIFSAMKNLKSLSNKQNQSKNLSDKITSSFLIEIDDDEDAETSCDLNDTYSVSMENSKQKNMNRKLPFTFEDDSTDNEDSGKGTCTRKHVEMMTVNKPNANSTPLKSSKSKLDDEIIINSTNQISDISSPSNSTLNASGLSSLDTTIIQKSHENGKVFIQQNIIISPVKEATVTSNSDRNCTIISNTSTSIDNGISPSKKEKKFEPVAVSPDKTVASHYISRPIFRTPEKNKESNQLKIDKSSTFTTPIKRKLDDETNSASPQKKITSPKKGQKKEMNKTIYLKYVSLIRELFNNVYKSTYLKNIIIEEDTKILRVFFTAPEKYQFLCIKLYTWLPKWYNIFKFCHKINLEMTDQEINQLYKFLQKNKIIDTDYSNENVADLLNRLDKSDIQDICKTLFKWNIQKCNKEDLVNKLIKYSQTQSTLSFGKSIKDLILEQIKKKIGFGMKLNESFRNAFQRVFLLGTFTNGSFTSINDFFKEMLVPTRISPDFAVEEYLVFHTREDFLSYAAAVKYSDILENALASRENLIIFENCKVIYEKLRAIGEGSQNDDMYREAPHLKRFTAKYVYVRALSRAVERLKTKYPKAVKDWLEYMIFKTELPHRKGTWYSQLIWLHMKHLNPIDYEGAANLLLEVLKTKKEHLSEIQLYELGEMGERLKISKKYKIDQFKHDCIAELVPEPIKLEDFPVITVPATAKRSNDTGKKRKYVVRDDEGNTTYLSVEKIALDYYLDGYSYTDGRHCEGSLIKASFTLFFWDIIYIPEIIVPAVFLSKLQSEPLDMRTRYFYENRKNAIDRRLQEIHSIWSEEQIKDFIKNNWTQHSHEAGFCEAGLHIENIELLEILVDCIGRKVLSKIYERLVKNIRQHSSGIPDLLIWNVSNKKSKFVEVKGENDRLSIGQKLWLKYLKSIGADVEVCLVHSTGSKRKSVKKLEGQKPEPSNKGKDFKASPSSTKKEKLKSDVKRGSKKLNSAAGDEKSKTLTYLSRKMSDSCTSSEESDFPSSDESPFTSSDEYDETNSNRTFKKGTSASIVHDKDETEQSKSAIIENETFKERKTRTKIASNAPKEMSAEKCNKYCSERSNTEIRTAENLNVSAADLSADLKLDSAALSTPKHGEAKSTITPHKRIVTFPATNELYDDVQAFTNNARLDKNRETSNADIQKIKELEHSKSVPETNGIRSTITDDSAIDSDKLSRCSGMLHQKIENLLASTSSQEINSGVMNTTAVNSSKELEKVGNATKSETSSSVVPKNLLGLSKSVITKNEFKASITCNPTNGKIVGPSNTDNKNLSFSQKSRKTAASPQAQQCNSLEVTALPIIKASSNDSAFPIDLTTNKFKALNKPDQVSQQNQKTTFLSSSKKFNCIETPLVPVNHNTYRLNGVNTTKHEKLLANLSKSLPQNNQKPASVQKHTDSDALTPPTNRASKNFSDFRIRSLLDCTPLVSQKYKETDSIQRHNVSESLVLPVNKANEGVVSANGASEKSVNGISKSTHSPKIYPSGTSAFLPNSSNESEIVTTFCEMEAFMREKMLRLLGRQVFHALSTVQRHNENETSSQLASAVTGNFRSGSFSDSSRLLPQPHKSTMPSVPSRDCLESLSGHINQANEASRQKRINTKIPEILGNDECLDSPYLCTQLPEPATSSGLKRSGSEASYLQIMKNAKSSLNDANEKPETCKLSIINNREKYKARSSRQKNGNPKNLIALKVENNDKPNSHLIPNTSDKGKPNSNFSVRNMKMRACTSLNFESEKSNISTVPSTIVKARTIQH